MQRFVIGMDVTGYIRTSMEDERLLHVRDGEAVIVLANDDEKGIGWYPTLRKMILNGNRIILIMYGQMNSLKKSICRLMALYGKYDIYTVPDLGVIDENYVNVLEKRQPAESEVSEFIGTDITAYSELNDFLALLTKHVNNKDADGVKDVITNNLGNIAEFSGLIDYMRRVVSRNDEENVEALKNLLEEMKADMQKADDLLHEKELAVNFANEQAARCEEEALKMKQRVTELEGRLNNRQPVITAYTEVQTQNVKCRVKAIIYFKEVSHMSYTASMVLKLMESITKIKKLKVKLVIYDNPNGFLNIYKPLPIIGSGEFMCDRDIIVNKYDRIVAIEANQALMEDIILADYDVVMVYDRLRQVKDIVTGNNVYKYWILNSMSEYDMLKQSFRIDKSHIITRPGVFPESLTIQFLKDYKTHTPSAKLSDYVNMISLGERKEKLFELIYEGTNINVLKPGGA